MFALVSLNASAFSWCQSGDQASLGGVALDPSGAVIADVQVKARNLNTSFAAFTTTNDHGMFRFAILPIGPYSLTAEHQGFGTVQLPEINLAVGANLMLTLHFNVAGATEAVTVSGKAPMLELSRSELSTTIDNHFISNLPVNGRDFTTFVMLTPGVSRDVRGGLSFAGQRAMNSLLVDGINNDDPFWGQPTGATGFLADGRQPYYISQDAVREFQVNSNAYSAEFGRAGGGVINTLTKSGTNDFHGSGFWFYRDRSMNANDPINKLHGLPRDPFHFNQFGATLGGPVRRDKLFFFANYEGLRSNLPNAVFLNLPAAFQLSPDPTISGFQQKALDYLKARADAWIWPITQNDSFGKLDWQISQSHRLTALLDVQRFAGGGDSGPQNSYEHTQANPQDVETGSIALTSAISERTANVLRFGYLGEWSGFDPIGFTPEANIYEQSHKVLTIGRNKNAPQRYPSRQLQWSDTLHHNVGLHALKFGLDGLVDRIRFFFTQDFSGSYDFGSLESFGRNLSGNPQPHPDDDYTQSFSGFGEHGVLAHPDFVSFAGFAEDAWRIRPHFTLNLGLRYDLQTIDRPPVQNSAPALLAANLDTSALPIDKYNFGPRIGAVWSPGLNSRWVLRGGYGIFYALTPSVLSSRAYFQNGVTTQTRTFRGSSATGDLIPVYPNTVCGPPDPSGLPPDCAPPTIGAGLPVLQLFSALYRQPYVQQGSLEFERGVTNDLTVSASYIVSKGTHLQQIRDVNLGSSEQETIAVAGTNQLLSYRAFQDPRPVPGFGRILVFNSDASSIYHGLAFKLNKRLSHNVQILASYTLSKVMDNNPNVYALDPGAGNAGLVQDPTAPWLDRGLGDDDQRHRFTFAAVWKLTYGKTTPEVVKGLVHGWEFSGILSKQSGRPYSALINSDLNNDGDFATDRTPGARRNTFQMPSTVSLEPRVMRTFIIEHHAKVQIIWEAFNVTNHANITGVNNVQYSYSNSGLSDGCARRSPCLIPQTQGLTAFGSPVSSSGARIMQVAIKAMF